jgi:hypothetical protein
LKPFHCILLAALLLASVTVHAERELRGITFARAGDTELKLDRCLTDDSGPAGLMVWAHGGPAFTHKANLARIDAFPRRSFTHHE